MKDKLHILLNCIPDSPFKSLLESEVVTLQDYTRAVISERDHLLNSLHTCGPTCSKAGCVNVRLAARVAALHLDAERLKEAVVAFIQYDTETEDDGTVMMLNYNKAITLARAAIEAVDNEIAKHRTKHGAKE